MLEEGATLATAAINLKTEKTDVAKNVKMSWIKQDKKIMEKVSEADLEKFAKLAKEKFPQSS